MKRIRALTYLSFFTSFLFFSCQIGLGSAVDTRTPNISFDEKIPAAATVKGPFTLNGTWDDDGVINIDITMTNLSTNVSYKWEKISKEKESLKDGVNKGTWTCSIDPSEKEMKDGKYEIEAYIRDTYGHDRTISKQIILDNTAPVLVISRPTYGIDDMNFDSYGQDFIVSGFMGDSTSKKYLQVEIYDSNDEEAKPVYTSPLTKVNSEFSVLIASKENEDANLVAAYNTIYGEGTTGTKKLYCKIYAFDDSVNYENTEDKYGNCADYFYLYESLYSTIFEEYDAIDIYDMNSNARAAENTVLEVLENNKISKGQFSINPANNPSFKVSGKDPLNKDQYDFIEGDETYHITNGSTLVIEIEPGLDETPLEGDTLGVYVIEWDSEKYDIKEGAEKYPIIKPVKILNADGVLVNNPDITAEEINDRNDQDKKIFSKSGSTYKIKFTLMHDGNGLQVGKKYIFGIYGYDQKGVAVKNAEDTYGFLLSTNVAPTVKITTPADYSSYLKAGLDLTVSGTATTEVGKPDVYIYVNETQIAKLEATTLTSTGSGSKVDTSFTYTIPANIFADAKTESGTEEFTIEAKAVYCDLPATTQKTVFYDTQAPVVDITSPAENAWLAAIGNVAVSGKISDDLGGVDKVYYSTTTKTDKTDRSKWTELVYTGASFNQNLVTTTAEGKATAYIAFYATDKAGNESDILVREINVDTANPSLSGLKYESGESFTAAAVSAASGTSTPLASDTYMIGGSYSDTGTSVSVTATRDGEAVTVTQSGTKEGTWQISEKEIEEGAHTYEITATDESGKKVTNKITINADKSEPTVALTERPGKEDTKASSYTFSGTSYDGEKGSGVASVTVTITDAADSTKTHTATASGTTNWSLKVEYESDAWKEVFAAEGQKNIVLKATDNAGNVKENAINTFVYDKNDPVLTVTSGATQQYMTSSGFSFAGTASDTYGLDELKLIEKKWENEAWVETEASRNAEAITITGGAWTAKVPLGNVNPTDGRYQYQFVLTDAVDHDTHSVIYSTTVDTTAPVVTLTTPAPSANYATDKKSVKMGVSAVNETTYRFAGNLTEANGISGVYYKILESSLGTNPSAVTDVLNASAWTGAGWTVADYGAANFNFTKDFISGTTSSETELAEGNKKLCVYAVDAAGNVSSLVTSLFDVDMSYPSITSSITLERAEDENRTYLYPKTLRFGDVYYIRNTVDSAALSGTISYGDTNGIASVVYKIGNTDVSSKVTKTGNTWTIAKSEFAANTESSFTITVTDVMGKAVTNSYTIFRDETIPVVEIEYPTDPNKTGTFDATKYVSINATSVQANGTIVDPATPGNNDATGCGVYVIQFTTKGSPTEADWRILNGYSAGSTTWSQQIDGNDFVNEGEIILKVRAIDRLGNISDVKQVPFSYDKNPPTLTINDVGKYQNYEVMKKSGAAGFTVSGTAADTNGLDHIDMIVDEGSAVTIKNFDRTSSSSWSYTFNNSDSDTANDLSEGLHTIELRLYDVAHRITSKTVTTTVDTKAPDVKRDERKDASGNVIETKIEIPFPTVDETEKSSYRFIGEAEDATTSVVKVELIFADGNLTLPPENPTIIEAEGKASWRYNCEFNQLPAFSTSGYKTIFVRATDIAGNVSAWAAQSFMYDTGKPEVVFEKFNDGSDVNIGSTENHNAKGVFTLSGNISDDWGFNFGTEQNPTGTFKITQNDVDITSLIAPIGESNQKDWTITGLPRNPSNLSETLNNNHITGVYKYKIIAKDKAGKTTEKTVTISIDTEKPEIQITQPAGNQSRFNYFSGTDYTFYGFATDDGHGTSGLQSYSYQFVKVDDLGSDPDAATKAATDTWETVTAPNGNFSIKKSLKKVNETDTDTGADPKYLSEGKWILYFKAIDKAGNETAVSNISFWVDQGNPVLTTNTVELITKDGFILSGTATDTNTNKFLSINIKDNKSSYTATKQADATNGSWETDTITVGSGNNLADGTHELVITATDVAGRTTQVTKSVVVDTVPPVVTEISKPLGIDFDNATVQITGSVTDATPSSGLNEVYIQFTDGTNISDAVKVTGTGSWSYTLDPKASTNKINTVFDTQGQKTINVYAFDKAGNQSVVKTQNFIYDTENPAFTVNYAHIDGNSSVENNDALIFKQNGYTLSGTFTDSGSNVTVAVTRDGTDISSSLVIKTDLDAADTNGNLKAGKWSLAESSVADGEHTYVVTVTDASERRSSSKFTILVDTKAPELKFTDADKLPDRDNTKATSYTFTGGASDEVSGIKTSGIKDIYVNITDKNDASLKTTVKATGSTLWTANVAYDENKDENDKNAFKNGNIYVEGPKTVTVTISDVAGNTTTITPTNHEFVYDRSNPVLEVTATSIQKYMSKAGFVISGTASDTYQVGTLKIIETKDGTETDDSKAGVFVTLNDINAAQPSAKEKKWEIKVPLSLNKATPVEPTDGKYTYQFILTDTVGHQVESKQYTATVDTTAPSNVTITTPSTTNGVSVKTGTSAIDETTYRFAGSFTEANEMNAVWYKILPYDSTTWNDASDDLKSPANNILAEDSWKNAGWSLGDVGTGSFKFTEDFHSNVGRSAMGSGEGNWMLCMYAVDAAGNVSSLVKSQFDVDMSAPTITTEVKNSTGIITLGNATNVQTSNFAFRFSMFDTNGIDENAYGADIPYSVTVKENDTVLDADKYEITKGARVSDDDSGDEGYYLVTVKNDSTGLGQKDGIYDYSVSVKDTVGKLTTVTKTIQLDTTPPELSVTSPNFADYQNKKNINISGSAIDDSGTTGVYYIYGGDTPSVPIASSTVDVLEAASWTNLGWNAVTSGTTSWSINNLAVEEIYGGKKLYVAAVDKHGNVTSRLYTATVKVDTQVPVVTETGISGNSLSTNTGFTLNGVAYDINKIKKLELSVQKENDAANADKYVYDYTAATNTLSYASTETNDADKVWTKTFVVGSATADEANGEVKLTDGKYTFTITATDNADKQTVITKTVLVDTTKPELNTWKVDTDLISGEYKTNDAGNLTWVRRTGIPIKIELKAEASGITTSENNSVEYTKGTVTDTSTWLPLSNGTYWNGTVTCDQGTNVITVRAKDAVGNISDAKIINVSVDTMVPDTPDLIKVDGETLESSKLVNGSNDVSFTLKAADDTTGGVTASGIESVTVTKIGKSGKTISATSATPEDGSYNYSVTIPKDQLATGGVEVTVTDVAGNTSKNILFQIDLDNVPPSVEITSVSTAVAATENTLGKVNGLVTIKGTASDKRALKDNEPVEVLYQITSSSAALNSESDWKTTAADGSKSLKSGVTKADVTGETVWEVTGVDVSANHGKYLHIRAQATDSALNEKVTEDMVVEIDQNTDRPEIRFTSVKADGSTVLKLTRVTGSIMDDDGDIENFWYFPSVKTGNTWSTPSSYPTYTGSAWNVPAGWFEVDEHPAGGSFALNAKQANGQEAEDGRIQWYFAVADKNHKLFTTANTNAFNQPTIVFEGAAAVANDRVVEFSFDTKPPAITAYKLLHKTNAEIKNLIDNYNNNQTDDNKITDGKLPPEILAGLVSETDWSSERNLAYGSNYKYLYAKVNVFELTEMDADPIEAFTYAHDNGITISAANKNFYVDETDKANGNYVYIVGPFDVSSSTSVDDYTLQMTVKDKVGNQRGESLPIVIDNTGPQSISEVKPKAAEEITDAFVYSGMMDDRSITDSASVKGSGVVKVQYYLPKDSETDVIAVGQDLWREVSSITSATWQIEFTGENGLSTSRYLDYKKINNSDNYGVSTDYDSYEDNGQGIYNLPIWFKLTDKVGNVGYNTENVIKYNPNAARPSVSITSPEQPNSLEISGTTVKYEVMGGSARISGTAEDDQGIKAVYLQFDLDGDGNWDNAANDAYGSVKISELTSSDVYAVKANGTRNWYYSLDLSNAADVNIETNQKYIRVRAIAIDIDTPNTLSSAWSNIVNISVDNSAPSVNNLKVRQYEDSTKANMIVEKDYSADMYLKGENWYLTADVHAANGISEAKIGGTTVTVSDYFTTPVEDNPSNLKMEVPVVPVNGIWSETITISDKSENPKPSDKTYTIKVDNQPPEFFDKWAAGSPNGTVKHYMNEYGDIRGTPLVATSAMQNSNGTKTTVYGKITGMNTETASGFDKVVFYFRRTTAAGTNPRLYNVMEASGSDNTDNRTDLTAAAKTVGKVFIDNPTSGTSETDFLPMLYVSSVSGKMTVTRPDEYKIKVELVDSTLTGIAGNKNIRKGGLIRIGGVYRTITNVDYTNGIVEFDSVCDTSIKEAEFVYGMVVSSNGESERADGTINESDGDGMLESYSNASGTVTWSATFNSANIPDGPIEFHVVAFDLAGNAGHGYTKTKVSNNPPRITKVMLGTDLNGNGSYETSEYESFYAVKNNRGETDLTSGKAVWNLDTKAELGGSDYFTVKNGLALIPEFVGGTGDIYWKFKKTVLSPDELNASTTAEKLTETLNRKALESAETMTSAEISSNKLTSETAERTGNKAGKLTLNNSAIGDSGENNTSVFSFSFWDSTEETTYGTDSGSAVLNAFIKQDLKDDVGPKVVVDRFHWYGKGTGNASDRFDEYRKYKYGDVKGNNKITRNLYTLSGSTYVEAEPKDLTDDSIVYRKVQVPYNNLYDSSAANGHIELEDDLNFDGSSFSSTGTGVNDLDPKVSGKITFTGSAYDNVRIDTIYFKLTKSNGTRVFAPTSGTAGTGDYSTYYTAASTDSNILKSSHSDDLSDTNNWKFTVTEDYFNQSGHKVNWELSIDTSKITGVAAADLTLEVKAVDATGQASAITDATGDDNLSDAKMNRAKYKVDVVPYVTGVRTEIGSKLKTSIRDAYSRTAKGHYIVRSGESITFTGFNLTGAKFVKTEARAASGNNAAVEEATEDLANGVLDSSKIITSGSYRLKVGDVYTLNNVNNNYAKGSYAQSITKDTSYEIKKNYAYNSQANDRGNNRLADDVILDVWEFDSDAAKPESGELREPVMKINPKNGKIGFAFVAGPSYFSMPGINKTTFVDTSYEQYQRNYATYNNIGMAYDNDGWCYGVSTGLDTNPNSGTAGRFTLMTTKWGKDTDSQNDNYNYDNKIRFEAIGIPAKTGNTNILIKGVTKTTYTMTENRFASPSLVSTGNALYLAYYDAVQGQIRFRYGIIPDTRNKNINNFVDNKGLGIDQQDRNGSDFNNGPKQMFESYTDNFSLIAGADWQKVKTAADSTNGYEKNVGSNYFYDTGFGAAKYVSIDAQAGAAAASDTVVAVWFDGTDCRYAYTTDPTTGKDNGKEGGWTGNKVIFSGGGEFCTVKLGPDGSVHIAANVDGSLKYAYLSSPSAAYNEATDSVIIDSYSNSGEQISIDVGNKEFVSGNTTSYKVVPYISYYNSTAKRPGLASLVIPENGTMNYKLSGVDTNGFFTGDWEVTLVPTPSDLSDNVATTDKINVGLWKKTDSGTKGIITSCTDTIFGDTHPTSSSNTSSNASGNCYGNGTKNPVLGYSIKDSTGNFITVVETAQMR